MTPSVTSQALSPSDSPRPGYGGLPGQELNAASLEVCTRDMVQFPGPGSSGAEGESRGAHQRIAKGKPDVDKVLNSFVAEMKRRKAEANGPPVDVLNLSRALALDTVTAYLFREYFNGIDKGRLCVTEFINFVAGGRIFYLPGWLYDFVDEWAAKLDKKKIVVAQSIDMMQEYATRVADRSIVEEKDHESDTFQGRLLAAGISRDEAIAHVVGAIFAESLRLAMANPTRFRHIVPPGGMQVPGLPNIPAGTSVGAGAFMLHHNPEAFPNPGEFMPERWLSPSQEMLLDSFYFGSRSRQCIARNLASAGLWRAAEALVLSDVLRGAMVIQDKLKLSSDPMQRSLTRRSRCIGEECQDAHL
ncbi:cytochrome P450 [Fusarium oxysporum f. sp. phaseoli]